MAMGLRTCNLSKFAKVEGGEHRFGQIGQESEQHACQIRRVLHAQILLWIAIVSVSAGRRTMTRTCIKVLEEAAELFRVRRQRLKVAVQHVCGRGERQEQTGAWRGGALFLRSASNRHLMSGGIAPARADVLCAFSELNLAML